MVDQDFLLYLAGFSLREQGIDLRINRLTMEEDAVSCPVFEGGPGGDGNSFAGGVANSHHDLQPK